MAEFMKRLSHTSELSTEYTNYCIRATTITILNDSGFQSRHIVTMSGHKNQASLTSYCYDTSGILFNQVWRYQRDNKKTINLRTDNSMAKIKKDNNTNKTITSE
jgi:hypothetical protein